MTDIDATKLPAGAQGQAFELAQALDCSVSLTVPYGHGIVPGMTVRIPEHGAEEGSTWCTVTAVTATTIEIRQSTLRERWALRWFELRRVLARAWWRLWDTLTERGVK